MYAQAEDDFVEILFSFLVIPLGEVERLLESGSRYKSLDLLYMSAADHIGYKYFKTSDAKSMLIKIRYLTAIFLGTTFYLSIKKA